MIFWQNGDFFQERVIMDPSRPGFRFGVGVYETVLYNGKEIMHLDRHVERLHQSLDELGLPHRKTNPEGVIRELLHRNGFHDKPSRVNIFCPLDGQMVTPVILVAPYLPPHGRTLRLRLHPEPHATPLARHKVMNHMFFHLVREAAHDNDFDDAIVIDHDGNIAETTIAALLFRQGDTFVEPQTPYKLPSTGLALARERLTIVSRPVTQADLDLFDNVYALNALMGMRPVRAIDDQEYDTDAETCALVSGHITGM